jgi:uncharacterized protein Yka (UPF0111/DUF47 family)
MSINEMIQAFLPKDTIFKALLKKLSDQTRKNCQLFAEANLCDANLDDLENDQSVEEIVDEMIVQLSENFITPFDREDIFAITQSFENINQNLRRSCQQIRLFKIDTQSLSEQIETITGAVSLLDEILVDLKNKQDLNTKLKIRKVSASLEDSIWHYDQLVAKSINALGESKDHQDIAQLLKQIEIQGTLLEIMKSIHRAAWIMQGVLIKYA